MMMDVDATDVTTTNANHHEENGSSNATAIVNEAEVTLQEQRQRQRHRLLLERQKQILPANRFELELEFVQCLASPAYIHFLATNRRSRDVIDDEEAASLLYGTSYEATTQGGVIIRNHSTAGGGGGGGGGPVYLQDPIFLQYLEYLRDTWSQPEYARFLLYPHCLYMLDLILMAAPTQTQTSSGTATATKNRTHSMISTLANEVVTKEWAQPAYRNFVHQQQYLSWQTRHSSLYGTVQTHKPQPAAP